MGSTRRTVLKTGAAATAMAAAQQRICSAEREGRNCHVVLRERPCSHPL